MPQIPLLQQMNKESLSAAIPAVQIDSEFRVLHVNEAAALCGVQNGESLFSSINPPEHAFRLWHENCLRTRMDSPLDPLTESALHVRRRITAFHGFRLADIVYTHALGRPCATVFLYRSFRQFFRLNDALTEDIGYTQQLAQYIARLRTECDTLLTNGADGRETASRAIGELLSAAQFLLRIQACSPENKRMFQLSRLLDTYIHDILPRLDCIDCRIIRSEAANEDISVPTDAPALFLLFTMLLRILNDIGDDRCIRMTHHRYGADGEIRFSAHTDHLAALPAHIPAVSVLASYVPTLAAFLQNADRLAGCLDCYLNLHTDREAKTLTFSLYIPKEKPLPDFKSPMEAAAYMEEAVRCLSGLFRLWKEPTAPQEAGSK